MRPESRIRLSITSEEFGKIGDVIDDAFLHSRPHVALVLPGAWEGEGSCPDIAPPPSRERRVTVSYERTITEPVMTRNDAIRVIARYLDGAGRCLRISGCPARNSMLPATGP